MSLRGSVRWERCRPRPYCHLPCYVTNAVGEFAGAGNADLLLWQTASHTEAREALREAQPRTSGDVAQRIGLVLLTQLDPLTDLGLKAVVPCGFHQDASGVPVAGLSHAPLVTGGVGEVFGEDAPAARHQFTCMTEAILIADLGNGGGGGDEVETAQTPGTL